MANERNDLLGIMEQVVVPRVLSESELLPGVVHFLGLVDLVHDFLERTADVRPQEVGLPVVN